MAEAPVPFDYRVRPPTPALERYVESIWYARGTVPYTRERIAPTGSTVAIVVLGDPLRVRPDDGVAEGLDADRGVVIGPHDRPVVNEPLGETYALGVVGTPVGCATAFGVRPSSIRGRARPLDEAWPDGDELRDELVGETDPERLLDRLAARLLETLRPAVAGIDHAERAVAAVQSTRSRRVQGSGAARPTTPLDGGKSRRPQLSCGLEQRPVVTAHECSATGVDWR